MRAIGLELSDAGIMAAVSGVKGPVTVDSDDPESPGFALSEKNRWVIGAAAAKKAHLLPRNVIHTYWDRLDTKPLKTPGFDGKTHAELAYAHVEKVWRAIRKHGDAVVIAVPEYFTPEQLGIILGIADALGVPVCGFVSMALAASATPYPGKLLISVDMHLHRTAITALSQTDRLFALRTETLPGRGLYGLYSEFVGIIAGAFVSQTRYDPFHRAASEQHLYDRLPGLLKDLQQNATVSFQMRSGVHVHRIGLSREPFLEKIRPVFEEICRVVDSMQKEYTSPLSPVVVQATHRVNSIFGFTDIWAGRSDMEIVALASGAAAAGAQQLAGHFEDRSGTPLLSSRPWQADSLPISGKDPAVRPTHLLFRNMAYPISDRSLVIASGQSPDGPEIAYGDDDPAPKAPWCAIRLRGEDVLAVADSHAGVFIDGVRVTGETVLCLGQMICLREDGETFRLIATV